MLPKGFVIKAFYSLSQPFDLAPLSLQVCFAIKTLLFRTKFIRQRSTGPNHGHYDHTGAVSQLLQMNTKVKLICHPQAVRPKRYSLYPGKKPRQIAMAERHRQAIMALPAQRLGLYTKATEIFAGVGFSGSIARRHPLEDSGGPFYVDKEGAEVDLIEDDSALYFMTEQGLVILTGCCHSGLINTVQHIKKFSAQQRVAGIIGGLHLHSVSKQRMQQTLAALNRWMPDFVIPCHCTGTDAIRALKHSLGQRVSVGGSGLVKQLGSGV